ncbi:hypothetical protein NPIL_669101 [Nephila pilipes]|uniref:Invertebrate defensins family profile domain-containing protein n=1 Tax=Nephila pilipes TaxID=299642 RepID=A0A8X6M9H8_NEPPI|nr:hypothetical protein NPIL_669101 [Nephila pilipes]
MLVYFKSIGVLQIDLSFSVFETVSLASLDENEVLALFDVDCHPYGSVLVDARFGCPGHQGECDRHCKHVAYRKGGRCVGFKRMTCQCY